MIEAHENQGVEVLGEPSFGFDDKGPFYYLTHADCTGRHIYVDPAPCYTHDEALVGTLFGHLRSIAPLPFPLKVFILPRERDTRCNGWYDDASHSVWRNEKWEWDPAGIIALDGKRIPLHPAITRYLIPHEYGHAVFYHLQRLRGLKTGEELKKWYIENVRPQANTDYGCGKWHLNAGEVFANDFRILHARLEHEFWPHAGIPRPEKCIEAIQFWREVPKELGWEQ